MMGFVKFQKENAKKGNASNTIGLNQKGRFAFYKPVVEKFLADFEFVELFYDPDNRKIGIMPVAAPSHDTFRIQGKTTKMIVAKKFFNRFKLSVENKRYEFNVENGMLTIKL